MIEHVPAPAAIPAKKRYEWIDNARIVAAFLIMYVHVPLHLPSENYFDNGTVYTLLFDTTFRGRVPFFLILAGYFLARNITWSKAWDRFIWLLIPFAIWNLIVGAVGHLCGTPFESARILGIGAVFDASWTVADCGPCSPLDGPSWFLRDIMLLSLMTPLFIKIKRILPAVLLIYAVCWQNSDPDMHIGMDVTLAPETCFFYLLGVCLVHFRIDDAYRIFNKGFTPVLLIVLAFTVTLGIWIHHGLDAQFPISLLGMLLGAMMIAHCGVLIEKHLPGLSKRLVPLGPACFLVFMLHRPFFLFIERFIPDCILHSLWILLLPFPTFILIAWFFLSMKKYTPWLMPYLGHMKVAAKKAESPAKHATQP